VEFFEGCLSLPGLVALVPRARKVKVECLDAHGQPRVIRASGWHARILQHEIDHLSGALYVDRMRSVSLCSLDNFTRHWKGKSIAEVKRLLPGKQGPSLLMWYHQDRPGGRSIVQDVTKLPWGQVRLRPG
jgi:hypothetical protein